MSASLLGRATAFTGHPGRRRGTGEADHSLAFVARRTIRLAREVCVTGLAEETSAQGPFDPGIVVRRRGPGSGYSGFATPIAGLCGKKLKGASVSVFHISGITGQSSIRGT